MPERKRRILCAEAHQDIADLIALLLEHKGYEVQTTRTTAETLELAGRETFDLFIVNDEYVDGDSMELLEQLRRLHAATPVLLFSLDAAGKYGDAGQDVTVHYFLTKTSDFAALVQTIDKLLQAG
jgi:DNA-binding response OmpR family regulator